MKLVHHMVIEISCMLHHGKMRGGADNYIRFYGLPIGQLESVKNC